MPSMRVEVGSDCSEGLTRSRMAAAVGAGVGEGAVFPREGHWPALDEQRLRPSLECTGPQARPAYPPTDRSHGEGQVGPGSCWDRRAPAVASVWVSGVCLYRARVLSRAQLSTAPWTTASLLCLWIFQAGMLEW